MSGQRNGWVYAVQHAAATALGVNESARTDTVVAMLENNRRRAPGYWIQLALATGIATFGLVLGSTAVVIGAMLVSPLMGPIIELGMGLAVGSPFLALRALLRVALSVVVVVAGAAALTLSLPFQEVTSEITARTAPTALDLLVAVFCALTAAYTTVRPASDTTSAAAGTAIGIALVPPLCVSGFGLGTSSLSIARGAALLFTANFSAILVFAVMSFLILGYNQVDAYAIERDGTDPQATRTGRLATGIEGRLRNAFGSRFGLAVRFVVPAVLLASVYVPLRHALDEVTWEVRARDAIRRILAANAPTAVQTTVAVDRHAVTLHLLLVGSNEHATALEGTIRSAIASNTGVMPTVSVTAVPDSRTLAAASAARTRAGDGLDGIDVATIRQRVSSAIEAEWPTAVAGLLGGWELLVPSRATPTIVVRHLGQPLGPAGEALLADRWSSQVGAKIRVADVSLERDTASAALGRERQWLDAATPILEWVADADRTSACVAAPIDTSRKTTAAQQSAIAALRASRAALADRLTLRDSTGWRIHVGFGGCTARI